MPGLPPLNALRAFEATARHLSMKDAAAELAVTPGAVSQLVCGLDQRLGTQLFRRGNRSLVLTEAGQSYFAPIRRAFREIGEATLGYRHCRMPAG
jgi:LysR family glycine cleavage system transcriptional activator